MLLVVDDFEQALEGHADGLHTVRAELIEPIRALILAFGSAATDSRLVFTSRFQFTLPSGGRDLADRLLDLPLPGMDEHEARKQAAAKLAVAVGGGDVAPEGLVAVADPERLGAILLAAQGNPGLQDLLFSLALDNPAACDRCLHQMEAYRSEGTLPSEEAVREFFEKIAIEAILALLSPAHRELLRAATLFELPVPRRSWRILGGESEIAATRLGLSRLTSLGLIETYEDLHDRRETALAINALIRPLAGSLDADERRAKASLAAPRLLECWGGAAGSQERGYLGTSSSRGLGSRREAARWWRQRVPMRCGFLDTRFEYRQAAQVGGRDPGAARRAGCRAIRRSARRAELHTGRRGRSRTTFRRRALTSEREGQRAR
ncbi:MAG: hypothetical protein U0610_01535 [bacterium]